MYVLTFATFADFFYWIGSLPGLQYPESLPLDLYHTKPRIFRPRAQGNASLTLISNTVLLLDTKRPVSRCQIERNLRPLSRVVTLMLRKPAALRLPTAQGPQEKLTR